MKTRSMIAAVLAATLFAAPAFAGQMSQAGGGSMAYSKNIVETAVGSPDHKTLVAALEAAGLVETLQGDGPFTVFAPTDEAFARLPAGTVEGLLQPENKGRLTAVLTYHVVAGRIDSGAIAESIRDNGGSVQYATVQGQPLTFRMMGDHVVVEDGNGGVARIAAADLEQSNGVIHVIDGVVLPN